MAEMALLHDTSASFAHQIQRILKPRLESGGINIEQAPRQVNTENNAFELA